MIHAAEKAARRRRSETRQCLIYFVNTATIRDDHHSQRHTLPTGKVDRMIRFGGLRYATRQYFIFVVRMEIIYSHILSEEYTVTLGPNLVDQI